MGGVIDSVGGQILLPRGHCGPLDSFQMRTTGRNRPKLSANGSSFRALGALVPVRTERVSEQIAWSVLRDEKVSVAYRGLPTPFALAPQARGAAAEPDGNVQVLFRTDDSIAVASALVQTSAQ